MHLLAKTIYQMTSNRITISNAKWEKLNTLINECGITLERVDLLMPEPVTCPMYEADKAGGICRPRVPSPWFEPRQRRRQWEQYQNSRAHRAYSNRWKNAMKKPKKDVMMFPEDLFQFAKNHAKKKNIPFTYKLEDLKYPRE